MLRWWGIGAVIFMICGTADSFFSGTKTLGFKIGSGSLIVPVEEGADGVKNAVHNILEQSWGKVKQLVPPQVISVCSEELRATISVLVISLMQMSPDGDIKSTNNFRELMKGDDLFVEWYNWLGQAEYDKDNMATVSTQMDPKIASLSHVLSNAVWTVTIASRCSDDAQVLLAAFVAGCIATGLVDADVCKTMMNRIPVNTRELVAMALTLEGGGSALSRRSKLEYQINRRANELNPTIGGRQGTGGGPKEGSGMGSLSTTLPRTAVRRHSNIGGKEEENEAELLDESTGGWGRGGWGVQGSRGTKGEAVAPPKAVLQTVDLTSIPVLTAPAIADEQTLRDNIMPVPSSTPLIAVLAIESTPTSIDASTSVVKESTSLVRLASVAHIPRRSEEVLLAITKSNFTNAIVSMDHMLESREYVGLAPDSSSVAGFYDKEGTEADRWRVDGRGSANVLAVTRSLSTKEASEKFEAQIDLDERLGELISLASSPGRRSFSDHDNGSEDLASLSVATVQSPFLTPKQTAVRAAVNMDIEAVGSAVSIDGASTSSPSADQAPKKTETDSQVQIQRETPFETEIETETKMVFSPSQAYLVDTSPSAPPLSSAINEAVGLRIRDPDPDPDPGPDPGPDGGREGEEVAGGHPEQLDMVLYSSAVAIIEDITEMRESLQGIDDSSAAAARKLLLSRAQGLGGARGSDAMRLALALRAARLHQQHSCRGHVLTPARRQQLALETLQVWAPLSHQIGVAKQVPELEVHSYLLLLPSSFGAFVDWYQHLRPVARNVLRRFRDRLREQVLGDDVLSLLVSKVIIQSRIKDASSAFKKMVRGAKVKQELRDVLGMRVIVVEREPAAVAALLRALREMQPQGGRGGIAGSKGDEGLVQALSVELGDMDEDGDGARSAVGESDDFFVSENEAQSGPGSSGVGGATDGGDASGASGRVMRQLALLCRNHPSELAVWRMREVVALAMQPQSGPTPFQGQAGVGMTMEEKGTEGLRLPSLVVASLLSSREDEEVDETQQQGPREWRDETQQQGPREWREYRKGFKNYVDNPKQPSGYQSLHLTLVHQSTDLWLEVQIRSQRMHWMATEGPASHRLYKALLTA